MAGLGPSQAPTSAATKAPAAASTRLPPIGAGVRHVKMTLSGDLSTVLATAASKQKFEQDTKSALGTVMGPMLGAQPLVNGRSNFSLCDYFN